MIEPSLALQAGIRAHLIADATVSALVPADHIRAGSSRPEQLPCVNMAGAQTVFLGDAAGGQYAARVFLDLHIWAIEAGADTAKSIAFATKNALLTWPALAECELDEFAVTHALFPRDPDPQYGHGILKVEAVIRWAL